MYILHRRKEHGGHTRFMTVEQLAAYELIEKQQIPEMNSVGYLLRHKKTGARVALLSNDDENKVFNIGFRTPP